MMVDDKFFGIVCGWMDGWMEEGGSKLEKNAPFRF